MKALSIRQPWAWCICNLGKDVENREWKTKHRGFFLIHASKTIDYKGYIWLKSVVRIKHLPKGDDLLTGGIVGVSYLYDVVDKLPGNFWFTGKYGFLLKNSGNLPFVPMPGKPGFFDVEWSGK